MGHEELAQRTLDFLDFGIDEDLCMNTVTEVHGFQFKWVVQIIKLRNFQMPVAQVIQSELRRCEVVEVVHSSSGSLPNNSANAAPEMLKTLVG